MEHKIPYELSDKLQSNPIIRKRLVSVIWFGSIRNKQDIHERSDYDIQIILSKPSAKLTLEINKILQTYPYIDLSIMYKQDIFDHNNKIVFHDGTKGLFFIYVLAAGNFIYGENIYAPLIDLLDLDNVKKSVLITIREYLSRLRVLAAQNLGDSMQFKKYSHKLFKDILIYKDVIPLQSMSDIDNYHTVDLIKKYFSFSTDSLKAFKSINAYEQKFNSSELASLLNDYESLVNGVIND